MKAFLLTAGLGTRLMPITNTLPKCLIEIGGKPLIHWWFGAMQQAGITEVLINLHHFPQQVKDFVTTIETSIKVHYFMEETLLGSAGTLLANYDFVKNERTIMYTQNYIIKPKNNGYKSIHIRYLNIYDDCPIKQLECQIYIINDYYNALYGDARYSKNYTFYF